MTRHVDRPLKDPSVRREFAEQGFVLLPSFFTATEADRIMDLATDLILRPAVEFDEHGRAKYDDDASPGPDVLPIRVNEAANPDQVCRIEDLLAASPALADFVRTLVTPAISQLAGTEFVPFKDKLNFKHPGGGAFTPHQDYPAYSQFPPRYHITAMITLDAATVSNGCLLFPRNWPAKLEAAAADSAIAADPIQLRTGRAVLAYDRNGDIDPTIIELLDWDYVPTTPVDLVLFDSFVPHQSFVNASDRSRRAMFFTFNAATEGQHSQAYYQLKRADPNNVLFHWAVPSTVRRTDAAAPHGDQHRTEPQQSGG